MADRSVMDGSLRQATRDDIPAMHRIRLAVRENKTSGAIREEDYYCELEVSGRGWVVEEQQEIVAFAVGNMETARMESFKKGSRFWREVEGEA